MAATTIPSFNLNMVGPDIIRKAIHGANERIIFKIDIHIPPAKGKKPSANLF
jgi:hypothetical protein